MILSLGTNSTNNNSNGEYTKLKGSVGHQGMVDNQILSSSNNTVQQPQPPTVTKAKSVSGGHHHVAAALSPTSQPLVYLTPEQWLKYSAAMSLENNGGGGGGGKHYWYVMN